MGGFRSWPKVTRGLKNSAFLITENDLLKMTGIIWELPLFTENLKDVKCTYQKAKDTLKKLKN